MLHVFIDSNIYLRFYAYSDDTLEELEKFEALAKAEQITVYLNDQVMDEVIRNRESEIFRSLEKFQKSANSPEVPRFALHFDEAKDLIAAGKKLSEAKAKLAKRIADEIQSEELRADQIINRIADAAESLDVSDETVSKARLRRELGNPPGKPDSLGDQINWEALLSGVPANTDLHLVTNDGDFFSKLDSLQASALLREEWKTSNGGNLLVYRSLSNFTKKHFPDIKLPGDVIKSDAISKLASSGNFSWTHKQIARLDEVFDQLTYEDSLLIFQAMIDNSQVNWIATDPDVKSFYQKLYNKYWSKIPEEVDEQLSDTADYFSDPPF